MTPQRLPNPALVGKSAAIIAEKCGITVPAGTRVLIAPLDGVGRDYPLSIEKLCPVLSYYVVKDWREGCERCKQILRYGGMGHTMSIHSQNEQVILEFGLKKPAFRIVVNTPTTPGIDRADHRARSRDDPWLRRLRRQHHVRQHLSAAPAQHQAARLRDRAGGQPVRDHRRTGWRQRRESPSRSARAGRDPAAGITAEALTHRIDDFLGSRGFRGEASRLEARHAPEGETRVHRRWPRTVRADRSAPLDFVCEEDVRLAIQAGRTLVLAERAIVTPAARDLGEAHRVFTVAPWRG